MFAHTYKVVLHSRLEHMSTALSALWKHDDLLNLDKKLQHYSLAKQPLLQKLNDDPLQPLSKTFGSRELRKLVISQK